MLREAPDIGREPASRWARMELRTFEETPSAVRRWRNASIRNTIIMVKKAVEACER
jgi:hypothetical protein